MAIEKSRKKSERKPEVEISEAEFVKLQKYQVGEPTMRQVGIVAGRKIVKVTHVIIVTK